MLKRFLFAVLMSSSVAGGAFAQAAQDTNKCSEAAYDLAQAAEAKQFDNAKLDKIEDLLNKMEDLCDSDKLAEAMDVAKDIEAEINAQ